MDAFRFSPELFELRSDVQAALDEAGFDWFTHYSSVDPVHDLYGIEVCGIVEPDDAQSILTLLPRNVSQLGPRRNLLQGLRPRARVQGAGLPRPAARAGAVGIGLDGPTFVGCY